MAKVGISILGIYLIVSSISEHTHSFYSLSKNASFSDYLWIFGPSMVLLLGGIICLIYREVISSWISKNNEIDLSASINLEKIEQIIISILGLLFLLETIPYLAMTINHYFHPPNIPEIDEYSMKSFAFIQAITISIKLILACIMTFLPQKIQKLLHKTRSF